MASDRRTRRIERLLDEAEEAVSGSSDTQKRVSRYCTLVRINTYEKPPGRGIPSGSSP